MFVDVMERGSREVKAVGVTFTARRFHILLRNDGGSHVRSGTVVVVGGGGGWRILRERERERGGGGRGGEDLLSFEMTSF